MPYDNDLTHDPGPANDADLTKRLPAIGFLRLAQILELIPVSSTTWWDGVKEKRFPQPVKLGPRTTVWRVEDIRAFIKHIGMGRK